MRPPCAPARVIDVMTVREAIAIVRIHRSIPHSAPVSLFFGCD
jgi:hypothetical protein